MTVGRETVLSVCNSRQEASDELELLAARLRHAEVTDRFGVKIRKFEGVCLVILVDRGWPEDPRERG